MLVNLTTFSNHGCFLFNRKWKEKRLLVWKNWVENGKLQIKGSPTKGVSRSFIWKRGLFSFGVRGIYNKISLQKASKISLNTFFYFLTCRKKFRWEAGVFKPGTPPFLDTALSPTLRIHTLYVAFAKRCGDCQVWRNCVALWSGTMWWKVGYLSWQMKSDTKW